MDGHAPSGLDPGSGRAGRRRAMTNSSAPTYTNPASLQNPFPHSAEPSSFSRQRSLSSVLPTITVSADGNLLHMFGPSDEHSALEGRNQSFDRDEFRAAQPRTSELSNTGPGIGLGLLDTFASPSQQEQIMPPGSPVMHNNMSTMNWGQHSQNRPDSLSLSPFSSHYGPPSPLMSAEYSSGPSGPPFNVFESPISSSYLGDEYLAASPHSQFSNFAVASPGSNGRSYINSPTIGSISPRPLLTVTTHDFGPTRSFESSDDFSGSTPDWDARSPLGYASSSQDTSPGPQYSESGFPDSPIPSPLLGPEAAIDDGQLTSFVPPQEYQQEPEEDTTPTSLSQLPTFSSTTNLLLQVPSPVSTQPHHRRRESDPSPRVNTQVIDESARVGRSRSMRSSARRERSRSVNTRTRFVRDYLNDTQNTEEALQAPLSVARSPSPGAVTGTRGKRLGPMTSEARSRATDRRLLRDTCINCKVSKIQCRASPDLWKPCTKCEGGGLRSTGAQLCGYHSFSHKLHLLTLDYSSIYWITHLSPSLGYPSRLLLPMPPSLSLHDLQNNFKSLLNLSYPYIRVSSNKTVLYDLCLQGSTTYLTNDRNSSLSSHKNWPALINTLSNELEDGWLGCLTSSYRLKSRSQILDVLPAWTTQQGCFTYSLVSANGLIVQQLDPHIALQKNFIISAAQVARIIARKVERIGYDYLQSILPGEAKSKPSVANPPDPQLVRTLGLLALGLRFRFHLWSISRGPPPSVSQYIGSSTYPDCIEAVRWVCRSLYVNHCWLQRHVIPSLPHGSSPDTQVSISTYAGTAKSVTELMSLGESESGFMEWWQQGAIMAVEAELDPVVLGDDDISSVDAVMTGTPFS